MKKLIVMLLIFGFGAGSVIAQDAPRHDDKEHKEHKEKEKKHHHHHGHEHHDDHHEGGDKK